MLRLLKVVVPAWNSNRILRLCWRPGFLPFSQSHSLPYKKLKQPTAWGAWRNENINVMQLINKQTNLDCINLGEGLGGQICSTNEIFVCCVFDPKSSEKPKGWERISGDGTGRLCYTILYHTIRNIARGCVYFCEICWAHIFTQIHMYVMLLGQNSGGFCTFVTPSLFLLLFLRLCLAISFACALNCLGT